MKKGIANYTKGSEFIGQLLIKDAKKGVASNGNPFLTLILSDQTGTIEAKMWSVTKEQVDTFISGEVVNIEGVVSEYRGKAQLNINFINICQGDVDLSNFLESAPIEKSDMLNEILDTISNMENDKIRAITGNIIKKHKKDFLEYPAASSMHHAYVSGLAYHTVSMLRIAKSLCSIHPELNKDLLYAGVILHDLKKIKEYTGVISTERTLEGKLK
ncbi:3'-5' exonuclease, partial [Butyricicoccus sp. 1XD8-22]